MLEVLILHTLSKYDCTIYRVNKIIEQSFYPFLKPSLGAVSPAIKRLLRDGYVNEETKMSENGLKSKIVSITKNGEKHLKERLLNFTYTTSTDFLLNASLLIYCANILKSDEMIEFKKNMQNQIRLYKNYLKNNMENPYNSETELQRAVVMNASSYISRFEAICEVQ